MNDEWIICYPVAIALKPKLPSELRNCSVCGRAVWRAISSPPEPKTLCLPCAIKVVNEAAEPVEIKGPTLEQLEDIRQSQFRFL
jgi:hypothetical protein